MRNCFIVKKTGCNEPHLQSEPQIYNLKIVEWRRVQRFRCHLVWGFSIQEILVITLYSPITLFYTLNYILIWPIPIWPLTIRHNFPTNDTHWPNIAGWREFSESYGFRSSPSNWNFATLKERNIYISAFFNLIFLWAYPCGIRSFCGAFNFSTQSEISDFTHKLWIDQYISCS